MSPCFVICHFYTQVLLSPRFLIQIYQHFQIYAVSLNFCPRLSQYIPYYLFRNMQLIFSTVYDLVPKDWKLSISDCNAFDNFPAVCSIFESLALYRSLFSVFCGLHIFVLSAVSNFATFVFCI